MTTKKKRKNNCSCCVCGTGIYRSPLQIQAGNVYCSSKCCGIRQRIEKICPVCGCLFVGNKINCSRKCSNESRTGLKYGTGANRNKAIISDARKIRVAKRSGGICETCGNGNYNILQVHHIIPRHKGGSDDDSNLLILCPNCHMTIHYGVGRF